MVTLLNCSTFTFNLPKYAVTREEYIRDAQAVHDWSDMLIYNVSQTYENDVNDISLKLTKCEEQELKAAVDSLCSDTVGNGQTRPEKRKHDVHKEANYSNVHGVYKNKVTTEELNIQDAHDLFDELANDEQHGNARQTYDYDDGDCSDEDVFTKSEEKELIKAAGDSLCSGSCLPLLKQELKLKIQMRRHSNGEDQLPPENHKQEKWEEQIRKREKSRELNRKASIRFRQKKQKREKELSVEVEKLETMNRQLQEEVKNLRNKIKQSKPFPMVNLYTISA